MSAEVDKDLSRINCGCCGQDIPLWYWDLRCTKYEPALELETETYGHGECVGSYEIVSYKPLNDWLMGKA